MISLLFLACSSSGEDSSTACSEWREDVAAADHTLKNGDSCRTWSMAVGDTVAISVYLDASAVGTGTDTPDCTADTSGAVSFPNGSIYSNLGDDGPKHTFNLGADSEGEGSVDITCSEGSEWHGQFQVAAAL